jgi:protein-tyrosine phosphatase
MPTPSPLTELPLGLPGRIFRSPMPLTPRDPVGSIFNAFLLEKIMVVVVLAEVQECTWETGRDLIAFYRSHGMDVIHLPMEDFNVAPILALDAAVQSALARARQGDNLAIHCYAGLGRTGMFAACMAERVLGLNGPAALRWIRNLVPGSVEAPVQVQMVLDYPACIAMDQKEK